MKNASKTQRIKSIERQEDGQFLFTLENLNLKAPLDIQSYVISEDLLLQDIHDGSDKRISKEIGEAKRKIKEKEQA